MNILEFALKELLHRAYDESLIRAYAAKGAQVSILLVCHTCCLCGNTRLYGETWCCMVQARLV